MLVTKHLREYYLGKIGVETTLNKALRKVENSKSHEFVLKLTKFSFLKTVFLLRHHSLQVSSFSVNFLISWDRKSFDLRYFLAISSKEFALVTICFYFIISKTCAKMSKSFTHVFCRLTLITHGLIQNVIDFNDVLHQSSQLCCCRHLV